ncbi:MAG: hypothetical protein KF734_15100 [Saprospiraceae bacterium]|nr:hypothetical protein [Saprospiraceae bacterium]
MKKLFFLLLLFEGLAFSLPAQVENGACGTSTADQAAYTERLLANIAAVNAGQVAERGAVQYVPLCFHLVGDASGGGKARERDILNQLCVLNQAFEPMEMRFYLRPHPTYGLFDYSINNENVYNNQSNSLLMQNRRHTTALNIYVVNQAGTGPGNGTTLAYYSPSNDWIVSRRDQINGLNSNGTLPHEVGHFFSLRHTFYGWEEYSDEPARSPCFRPDAPGWPIAPAIAPYKPGGGPIFTEHQDGSNCTTAADLLCDTPPDYNFGFCQNGCSNYNGGARDPKGELVNPMENNYMGYFSNCNYEFTPQQQAVILADRQSATRNYLNNSFAPAALQINTPEDLLLDPPNGATTTFSNQVRLEWRPVAGATYYLLEVDRVATYNTSAFQSFVVATNSKIVTGLEGNRQYFWRVRPFNEYVTCAATRQRNFRTSTIEGEIETDSLMAVKIVPNPASVGGAVGIYVNAPDAAFEADIRVFDAMGRQVRVLNGVGFPKGESTLELPVEGLGNGLYFVAIENAEMRIVRRLFLARH